ncbi:MAG: adenosylcobinamide-GDP ribazoletransferase [Eubacteriaceae bacterium]
MRKLLIAISFFTRIPIKLNKVTEDEFYNAMILIPLVGIFIGGIMYVFSLLLSNIHFIDLESLLMLILYIWITGGLHLDGFSDTTDALFSARDREKMMVIMKDSRLGAFGAIGLILLLLTYWMCFKIILPEHSLLLLILPLYGRVLAIMSTCFSTYAQGGGGLGKRFTEMTKLHHFLIYLIILLVLTYLLLSLGGVIAVIFSFIPGIALMLNLQKKIGGMTGDTIGLTIELNQVFLLVIYSIIVINFI